MTPVLPTTGRRFERPTSAQLVGVSEIAPEVLARMVADDRSDTLAQTVRGRLFEVLRADLSSCFVTTTPTGDVAECFTHADGTCDAVDRVRASGLIGDGTSAEPVKCRVCQESLFNGTPLMTVEPTGRDRRPFQTHRSCFLGAQMQLARARGGTRR